MSPRYVEYGSLMTPPAPFVSLNTRLNGFWFEADGDRLDDLCHKVFTEPSEGRVEVRAIGGHVMITWGDIERVVPRTPGYRELGGVSEPQVAIWVPVAQVEDGVAVRFAMFVPYIWVDNAMSLAAGRELFGYPKAWGWPHFPAEDAGGPRRWALDAFGLDYAPDSLAGRRPLLEVVEGDAIEEEREEREGLGDLVGDIADFLFDTEGADGRVVPGLRFAREIWRDVRGRRFPHLFLKQFRSVEDGVEASLQQIAECWYEVTRLRSRPLLREHSLIVHPLDSHPVAEELGLRSQTTRLAYEVDMDFDVGEGRVLFDAGAVVHPG